MKDIIEENKRLKAEVEKLISDNMELVGVIRSLRANAREDNERLETVSRERDEARGKAASWIREWREMRELWRGLGRAIDNLTRELAEAREQVKELREALLRVRTWGVSSKNFSATDSYKMAEWIDGGCAGDLPNPDGPWIYEKMEETK